MFTIKNDYTPVPIKVWLDGPQEIEKGCLEQAYHLSKLPFLHQWVCLMPDTHMGKGMPIGGVIAADGVVIPNAVGVDIGCGMAFVGTNLKVADLRNIRTGNGTLFQAMIGDILRNIPVGFAHHKTKQSSKVLDRAMEERNKYEGDRKLLNQLQDGYYQIGTLGGGNHFIELQEDQEGYLGLMLHSGSRHFGYQVCNRFHHLAQELNLQWKSNVPEEFHLSYLPVNSAEGQSYIHWMQLSMDFAYENRDQMMKVVKGIVTKWIHQFTDISVQYSKVINCHHNYANLETHYGKEVWVHRKGAISAKNGELAIIPGAMGSYSYITKGLGCPESFCSSSHGAGRRYSRKGAMAAFRREEVMADLKEKGIILGKNKKSDVAEESRFAYKDIDQVMSDQRDLTLPMKKLKTIGVVKG